MNAVQISSAGVLVSTLTECNHQKQNEFQQCFPCLRHAIDPVIDCIVVRVINFSVAASRSPDRRSRQARTGLVTGAIILDEPDFSIDHQSREIDSLRN